ncbi:unnamed protein product [Absidia cylindrospora]
MCEWLSSAPTLHFHAKTGSSPISIQSSNLTRSMMLHDHDYSTPPSSFLTSHQPPPPLSSSTSSSSTASSISSSSPRKGSIAFTLNSICELQKLDQEEMSTNYQTHFTTENVTTPMMMDDDEDEEEDALCSFPSPSTDQAGFSIPTPTPTNASTHFAYPHSKKGLRLFSQHVCDILQQHGRATYNQLVQQLIEELNQPSCELSSTSPTAAKKTCDPKNIRRRVYDALNVLMAINFITKDKKEIRWIGSLSYSQQNASHSTDPMFDQDDISYYRKYMNNACDSYEEDDEDETDDYIALQENCSHDTDTMMVVEKDIQREEQRYQDLLQRIDLKRREIQNQIQQKYGPGCQHGLPDPLSFAP